MKRKVKLVLGINLLYDKDEEFYNHFTKNFRHPVPSGLRFYLEKEFQNTANVYNRVYFICIVGCHSRESISSYTKGFLIREVVL